MENLIFKNDKVKITKNNLYRRIINLIESPGFYKKIWFCRINGKHDGRLYYKNQDDLIIEIDKKTSNFTIRTSGEIRSVGNDIICLLIDHRCLDDPVSILVHECIHYFYDFIDEETVEEVENKSMKKLSWRQKARICKVLLKARELRNVAPIKRLNKI